MLTFGKCFLILPPMTPPIIVRSKVVQAIRAFFDNEGFLELHTPRVVGLPGQEPYLEPMWTSVHEHDGTRHRAALITSPEYAMKKMLAAGHDKIYDLGPCFRDGEPWDGTHDPEFLMIEWYRRDAGLEELMRDTTAMIQSVARALAPHIGASPLETVAFRKLSVEEAMRQYAGIELTPLLEDRDAMARVAQDHGQPVAPTDTWDDLFFKIFLSEVEPYLGWKTREKNAWLPTFLHTYPASMAALARKSPHDPRYALRTELYIGDYELANGFAELSDAVEQRARFEEEQSLRRSLGKDIWPIDEDFLQALPAMGNAAGIAFGVDRLAMLLSGVTSISELMPVPVRKRLP